MEVKHLILLFTLILEYVSAIPKIDSGSHLKLATTKKFEHKKLRRDDSVESDSSVEDGTQEYDGDNSDKLDQDDDYDSESLDSEDGDDEGNDESKPKEGNKLSTSQQRPLKAGDTFTPSEFLPISKKLITKVDNPGEGRGIVSSAKNPFDLSDRLFEAFFGTSNRIVILEDGDIAGIDALQALALDGEVARPTDEDYVTPPSQKLKLRGQIVEIDKRRKQSRYSLLSKVVKKSRRHKVKRRGSKLAIKLNKKRRLIMKKNRRVASLRKGKNTKTKAAKETKKKIFRANENGKTTKKPACRWNFQCTNPSILETCHLITKCDKPVLGEESSEFDQFRAGNIEKSIALKHFRKMLGLSIVDEEVERILEVRIINRSPYARNEGAERVESLAEYFNNIMMAERYGKTTPIPKSHLKSEEENVKNGNIQINSDIQSSDDGKKNKEDFTLRNKKTNNGNFKTLKRFLTRSLPTGKVKML